MERSHLWRGEEEEAWATVQAVWAVRGVEARPILAHLRVRHHAAVVQPLEEEADDTEAVDVGVVHREVDPQRARRRAEPVVGAPRGAQRGRADAGRGAQAARCARTSTIRTSFFAAAL